MKNYNFNTPWDSDYWMESNGFFAGLNMPEALISQKGNEEEVSQGLPPYKRRSSFLVDEYPACPKDWMPSEGRLASYFVPIQNDHGMWLDFNKNADKNHHVAIVVSIQGVNAITGLPCNDAQLEQYIDECPKHKKKFGPNRLCEEKGCGFKWPKQNYICTTTTPLGYLWLDGFRAANGAVQQYILTEKTMRGVASNIIGSKRVYAIGISFFLSKEPKPPMVYRPDHYLSSLSCNSTSALNLFRGLIGSNLDFDDGSEDENQNVVDLGDTGNSFRCIRNSFGDTENSFGNASNSNGTKGSSGGMRVNHSVPRPQVNTPIKCSSTKNQFSEIRTKNMEIGAGASIQQQVYDDSEPLDYWRKEPEALLCINYCLEDETIKILKQGKVSKQGHPQGFLQEVPVGN